MKLFFNLLVLLFLINCGGGGGGSGVVNSESHLQNSFITGTFFDAFENREKNRIIVPFMNLTPNRNLRSIFLVYLRKVNPNMDYSSGPSYDYEAYNFQTAYYRRNDGTFSNTGSSYTFYYTYETCKPASGRENLELTSNDLSDHLIVKTSQGALKLINLNKFMSKFNNYVDIDSPSGGVTLIEDSLCNKY